MLGKYIPIKPIVLLLVHIFTHSLPLNGSRQEMLIESLISSMLIPYRILPDHALNHALFQGSYKGNIHNYTQLIDNSLSLEAPG